MGPRISVVSIFYNAGEHFREAIDSVLAQSFRDFELLLVDDGATDGSTAIAKEYEVRDVRVRYMDHAEHANLGMSAARNRGLAEARGEFLAFIDADDRWRTEKLREQVALLDRMPDVDVVGGSVNYWASHGGGRDRVIKTGHVRGRPIPPGEASVKLYPLGRANAPSMSDLMFRRQSAINAGGFEAEYRGAYEDQAFLSKVYLRSTLLFSDAVWSDYRLHDRSCMAEVRREGRYDRIRRDFLLWYESYLQSTPFRHDAQIHGALNRALRPYRKRERYLREAAKSLPFVVPMARALRRLRPARNGPAILMYHRIAEEHFDPWGLAVSPAQFEEQLDWLSRNREIISLAEFARRGTEGTLARDAVAITFDDGYACTANVAAPLLERFGFQATVFVPTELIAREQEFWWDDLERIVLGSKANHLCLNGARIEVGQKHDEDRLWQPLEPPRTPRQKAFRNLWSRLNSLRDAPRAGAIGQISAQAGVIAEPRSSHRPMKAAELRALSPEIMEIGSHGMTHSDLVNMREAEKIRELGESIRQCTELTARKPTAFAYPHGRFDAATTRLVQMAGYDFACGTEQSVVRSRADRFALPRLAVRNGPIEDFRRMLGDRS